MSEKFNNLINFLDERICQDKFVNSDAFLSRLETQQKSGALHDERAVCPYLRPHFLKRSHYTKISNAAQVITSAFENLVQYALDDEKLLAEFGLSEIEEKMARINPGYKSLCVSNRIDAFWNGDDFKFLEFNGESPAGIADQMMMEKAVEMIPQVNEFLQQQPHWKPTPQSEMLKSLLQAYREFGGKKNKPNIAIVDWEGVSTVSEFLMLKEYFESEGYSTIIADPHQIEYDGEILRVEEFTIDIFYKRVVIHEFLQKFNETHPFVQAYKDGKICMANSFRTKIAHKKAGFAILTDEKYSHLFSREQLKVIKNHIPWTRNLRDCNTTYGENQIELLNFLIANQEKFLLKPNDDYGGKGIIIGWETSKSDWNNALNESLKHQFIVQERALVGKTKIPTLVNKKVEMLELLVDFDPFLFHGRVHGGLVRLSSQSLVNVTQGGGETALVILEDF